ncbi:MULTISPECIES: hydroxymethylbilane synthase [Sphingomonas]|jgi:hydroxymethylbilane synthase|uniref:Porphobilinogen deaminase n=1 Tax=Sphingomonas hankookensis TaxID=563996 RepID=A0ABR5YEB6_9SPHN|nr:MULTISPECIES: hydroxymethylbilane synthase [Sphingomonas]KZE14650.1 porphobilinogen deaminase [Sphingomonas hankookensis]PZT92143.1 MAG: hydroxymethylbilane synthase [Sphingomonas sp.]RSV21032.1 hydroxymethylbilane synthase [Sphingomonas sp. ABOLH]WCP72634.1 hydroxymethylbilane synthase [Sphingomonas hankookensis]
MTFKLGTRGSPLALVQAHATRDALAKAHGIDPATIEIVMIKTTGDRVQDRALAEIGGKALWTKELDRALCAHEIDAAVHSMKDVETVRPTEIRIAAMLPRADVRDRLVGIASLADLPRDGVVGTSSPRRAAQVLSHRPDARIVLFRGNVDTRLAKLAAGEVDATLLAAAGLERLGRHEVGTALSIDTLLPAPSQGAVGIEVRAEDAAALAFVRAIDHAPTHQAVRAERGFLAALGADCHSPVGALATIDGDVLTLRAQLLAQDGSAQVVDSASGAIDDIDLPRTLAETMLARAPESVAKLFAR